MMQKVVASELFKDQKDSYPQSVGRLFLDSRLGTYSYSYWLTQYLVNITSLQTYHIHRHFQLLYLEREQISLKVHQTLGSDKVQVGFNWNC